MIEEQPLAPEPVPPGNSHEESSPLPPPPDRYPFWNYRDLAVFAGMAIPCMLAGFAIVALVLWLAGVHPANKLVELLPAQAIGYGLLFVVLYGIVRTYDRPFWPSLGWNPLPVPALMIVSAGLGTAILVAVVGNLIGTPETDNPMTELLKGRVSILMMAAFGVTIGPLCEELAFRGFLQPVLIRSLGTVGGILAASLPFGLLHFQQYGKSWKHVLLISLAGAAFGWMRHATSSTKASTLMHSAYNAVLFVAFLSAKSLGH
jgi:uncharacterized protein